MQEGIIKNFAPGDGDRIVANAFSLYHVDYYKESIDFWRSLGFSVLYDRVVEDGDADLGGGGGAGDTDRTRRVWMGRNNYYNTAPKVSLKLVSEVMSDAEPEAED